MKNFAFFARLSAAYKNRSEPEQLRIVAEDSWKLLSVATVLVVVLSAAFGLRKIIDVSQGIEEAQDQTATNNAVTINQQQLDAASQVLQDRTDAFDTLAAGASTTTIPDPSE